MSPTINLIPSVPLTGWFVFALATGVLFFGILVFAQDPKKRSGRFFLLFAATMGMWGFSYVFFNIVSGTTFANTALTIGYFIGGFVSPTLLFFLYVFLNENAPSYFWKFVGILAPYLVIATAFGVPNLVVGLKVVSGDAGTIVFGRAFLFYVLYSVIILVFGLWFIIKNYRNNAGIFKIEIRGMLMFFAMTASVALLTLFFLPILTDTQNLFWVGYASAALFLFMAGSILIRYNFWSIKLVTVEFFTSLATAILLFEMLFASSLLDFVTKVGITMLVVFSSVFLVSSVKREIESKEKIARLAHNLDKIHAQLQVLDKKKSDFLFISSNHLRDPLTYITGYASMLLEGSFGELPVLAREAIEKIFESSKRLIVMISDFMDISNIETGNMQYKFTDVDMKKIVYDIIDDMTQSALDSGLSLNVSFGPDKNTNFITVADFGKIRQVLSNMVDNSIKYTPKGKISVLLSKTPNGKKIIFSVSDTGIGMSKNTKEKIFKKFSRAEGVNKIYTEGTGLGLYVASEIVKKHEGKIWAESEGEGHGSTFFVELDAKR